MKRNFLARFMGVAMALAVAAGFAGTASAGPRAYCDSYARDVAHRKTNGGADVLVGTIGGALGGALIGGLIDHGRGAGRGALIGGVGGTLVGAGVTSDRYRRAYDNAFERCMDNYEGQPVRYEPVAKVKKIEKAELDVDERTAACSRKYRSYDPKIGKYKSGSGRMRPCRLP
jgi:uncharacterized protein YcfJ